VVRMVWGKKEFKEEISEGEQQCNVIYCLKCKFTADKLSFVAIRSSTIKQLSTRICDDLVSSSGY